MSVVYRFSLRVAIPLCVCDKHYEISTVKHNTFIFYWLKLFIKATHFNTTKWSSSGWYNESENGGT
jgi:hypothetical protein